LGKIVRFYDSTSLSFYFLLELLYQLQVVDTVKLFQIILQICGKNVQALSKSIFLKILVSYRVGPNGASATDLTEVAVIAYCYLLCQAAKHEDEEISNCCKTTALSSC